MLREASTLKPGGRKCDVPCAQCSALQHHGSSLEEKPSATFGTNAMSTTTTTSTKSSKQKTRKNGSTSRRFKRKRKEEQLPVWTTVERFSKEGQMALVSSNSMKLIGNSMALCGKQCKTKHPSVHLQNSSCRMVTLPQSIVRTLTVRSIFAWKAT